MKLLKAASCATAILVGVALASCSAPADPAPAETDGSEVVAALRDRLPDEIKESGVIISGETSGYPPFALTEASGEITGVTIDLQNAIGRVLGVEVRSELVNSISSSITGLQSGRFDIVFGPMVNTVDREKEVDMIMWMKQLPAFAVAPGNPLKIGSIADICGTRIAVIDSSWAIDPVEAKSADCVAAGEAAVELMSFQEMGPAILAVSSGQADAALGGNAALRYFNEQSGGQLDIVGEGEDNGRGPMWSGGGYPKGSPLTPIFLDAFREIMANGTYAAILEKHGLSSIAVDEPVLNYATENQ